MSKESQNLVADVQEIPPTPRTIVLQLPLNISTQSVPLLSTCRDKKKGNIFVYSRGYYRQSPIKDAIDVICQQIFFIFLGKIFTSLPDCFEFAYCLATVKLCMKFRQLCHSSSGYV